MVSPWPDGPGLRHGGFSKAEPLGPVAAGFSSAPRQEEAAVRGLSPPRLTASPVRHPSLITSEMNPWARVRAQGFPTDYITRAM